jgi:hypothetical protein
VDLGKHPILVRKRIIAAKKYFITADDVAYLLKNLGLIKENGGGRIKIDIG